MTTLRQMRDAIKAVFQANWAGSEPVYWAENLQPVLPDSDDAPVWLHITVEFGTDGVAAFGGGRLANERSQFGTVTIRCMAASGTGEDVCLDALDAAVVALRGRRDGPLSFIGDVTGLDDGGSEDGAWFIRAALIGFEYRHIG